MCVAMAVLGFDGMSTGLRRDDVCYRQAANRVRRVRMSSRLARAVQYEPPAANSPTSPGTDMVLFLNWAASAFVWGGRPPPVLFAIRSSVNRTRSCDRPSPTAVTVSTVLPISLATSRRSWSPELAVAVRRITATFQYEHQ